MNRRLLLSAIGSCVILAAALYLAWSVVVTSSARVAASTSGSGSLVAGTVELSRPGATADLLFDADDLVPGQVVPSCTVLAYEGSVPARIHLHAARTGGTGLEEHVELRLWTRPTESCPDDTDASSPPRQLVFDGRLADLWLTHPDFDAGLVIDRVATAGARIVLEAEAELGVDREARGRTTEFSVVVEARP